MLLTWIEVFHNQVERVIQFWILFFISPNVMQCQRNFGSVSGKKWWNNFLGTFASVVELFFLFVRWFGFSSLWGHINMNDPPGKEQKDAKIFFLTDCLFHQISKEWRIRLVFNLPEIFFIWLNIRQPFEFTLLNKNFFWLFHRFKSSKYSGINILVAIMHWIWPPGRCQNCHSIYSMTDDVPNIKQIHRSDDGRFVLSEDAVDGVLVESKRNSIGSQYSSSDDGGFLPPKKNRNWRRPLVQWPSELSLRSDGFNSNRWIGFGRNFLKTIPQLHQPPTSQMNSVPLTENLHINTISANVPMISTNTYTPSRISRIHASSPATSSPFVNSPWSPLYFSDLSSVLPSSAERSFRQRDGTIFSPNTNRTFRSRNPRYINELPALRALHEDTRRMTQGFIPVQIPSPPVRSYYANIGPHISEASSHNHPFMSYKSGRPRTFRSYSRMLRAPPELASPYLNLNLNILEQSPESQSSSSGFGSKNTSSHQNHSSQSGGTTSDPRLPPYRPPPQPATSLVHASPYTYHDSLINSPSSPHSMSYWFELMQRLNLASTSEFKAVDVGSVDGHYEFDPSTPTPTASTPTGRDELLQHQHQLHQLQQANDIFGTLRTKRTPLLHQPRYDQSTIDARIIAMKEEFYAYRKRQAIKRAGIVLESAC